jgi:hypothetical protein
MVEKNTRICDVCDEHVAKCKCQICSKDICEDCKNAISVNFLDDGILLFNIDTCEKCQKQFSRVCLSEETIFADVMKDKPELMNEIVELVKNILMLKKISDEDIKKEEEIPSMFPSRPYPNINPYNPYPYKPLRPKPNPFKIPPYKTPPYKFYSKQLGEIEGEEKIKSKKTWWKK